MNNKENPHELKIKHLWELANALPPENHAAKLLRSYYLTSCKKISKREVQLPLERFAPSVMCPKCSSIWSQSEFSLSVKPQRIRSQKAQRLVEVFHKNPESLNKKQRARAKWLKKAIVSRLETKCEFCQKKTYHNLIKAKKESEKVEQEEEVEVVVKKKKKKKDKTAGLKLDKVKGVDAEKLKSQLLEESTEEKKRKHPQNQPLSQIPKQPQEQSKTKPSQNLSQKPPQKTLQQKPQHPQKPPHKLQQKLQKKPQKQVTKGKITKAVSNTQKQNSLLQLAAMLKNRSSATTSKGNNQLEKLLR